MQPTTKPPNREQMLKNFYVGLILLISTFGLIFLLGTPNFQKSNSTRYVASFLAGLFGFAAVETLRRSLDENNG